MTLSTPLDEEREMKSIPWSEAPNSVKRGVLETAIDQLHDLSMRISSGPADWIDRETDSAFVSHVEGMLELFALDYPDDDNLRRTLVRAASDEALVDRLEKAVQRAEMYYGMASAEACEAAHIERKRVRAVILHRLSSASGDNGSALEPCELCGVDINGVTHPIRPTGSRCADAFGCASRASRPSGEPSAIPEEPAAWAIIEDGAVVGLRIAKDDADYAAQAWSRPPLVAPLFLRSALSGGIPRSLSEEPEKCATRNYAGWLIERIDNGYAEWLASLIERPLRWTREACEAIRMDSEDETHHQIRLLYREGLRGGGQFLATEHAFIVESPFDGGPVGVAPLPSSERPDEGVVRCAKCERWHSGVDNADVKTNLCEDCAPSSERAVSEEERTAILDAARMLYAVDGEVTAAEEKGSTSEFDREDFYGALSIAEELQTLAARLDGSTKDMVDMHKWPDGQVREEEPYRCGVFIAATGQQCLGLSDHEGNCWFDPVARPAPSLPVMPPAISGDALLKYTLDFHAAVEALPASETQSLLTMMCGAADKLAHEFEFSAIWIGPIHKGVREILRVRAELDASRERQKNA